MRIKINSSPSNYEALYILWNGIDFDKEKLIKFVKRLNFTRLLSFLPRYRKEYNVLVNILKNYNEEVLFGLMNNDEQITRLSIIEKYARIGALDITIHGTYSRETYRIISNLPSEDYKLILRRVDELVKIAQTTTYQSDNLSSNIPGT